MKQCIVTWIAVFFLTNAYAGNEVQSKKMADLSAQGDETIWTIATMTCLDVFDLFDDATPGDKKKDDEVMAAQDDVLDLLTWVHGYLSGRDGLQNSKYTMNKVVINQAFMEVAAVCKTNEDQLFLDVVPQIK